jgi:uncharacterized membrane protein YhaH (DUF805 family)
VPRITISYRRDDSGVITGRIFDRLAAHFGRESVFRDIDNIPPGVDFRKHIDAVLDESDVILAIVGPKWVGPRTGQSRLANTADPVRLEIETALGKGKPLIPVLVLRATMPRPEQLPESLNDFAYRNAVQIDSSQDFDVHIARLVRAMERILAAGGGMPAAPTEAVAEMIPDREMLPQTAPTTSAEIAELRAINQTIQAQLEAQTDAQQEEARAAARLREEIAAVQQRASAYAAEAKSAAEKATLKQRELLDTGHAAEQALGRVRELEAEVINLKKNLVSAATTSANARGTLKSRDVSIAKLEAEKAALISRIGTADDEYITARQLRRFLLSLRGRVTRSQFWLWFAPHLVINAALWILIFRDRERPGLVFSIWLWFSLVTLWPSVAISVKRIHDRGNSGWLLLIFYVPLLSFIQGITELSYEIPGTLLWDVAQSFAGLDDIAKLAAIATLGAELWFFANFGLRPDVDQAATA